MVENIILRLKDIERLPLINTNINPELEINHLKEKEINQINIVSDLSIIYDFLDTYQIKSYEINSKLIEPEISNALIKKFGIRYVKTQVSVTGGKIDIECKNIGIEIKTPTSLNDLRSMVAQLLEYRKTYNSNLILFIINAGARPTDIYTYTEQCISLGIKVIIKD